MLRLRDDRRDLRRGERRRGRGFLRSLPGQGGSWGGAPPSRDATIGACAGDAVPAHPVQRVRREDGIHGDRLRLGLRTPGGGRRAVGRGRGPIVPRRCGCHRRGRWRQQAVSALAAAGCGRGRGMGMHAVQRVMPLGQSYEIHVAGEGLSGCVGWGERVRKGRAHLPRGVPPPDPTHRIPAPREARTPPPHPQHARCLLAVRELREAHFHRAFNHICAAQVGESCGEADREVSCTDQCCPPLHHRCAMIDQNPTP